MQALQTEIQIERVLGRLDGAEVAHQLGGALGNEGAFLAELLSIGDAVIAVVGGAEAGELVGVSHPVKLAGIDDGTAHGNAVAVHVLGGGVGDDIAAPLDGTAVHGSGEGVVDDQGNAVGVGGIGELLNVQHGQGGVGDGLTKDGLGVGTESGFQFLVRAVGRDEGELNAHLCHGDGEEVEGAAVNGAAGDHMVAAVGNVENGVEVGGLTGGGQHGSRAAFQLGQLGGHIIVGGILQAGIEIAGGFQIEELAHILTGGVLEGSRLYDGDLAGLAVAGGVAALHAFGLDSVIAHGNHPFA